jgi:hypothetical protein
VIAEYELFYPWHPWTGCLVHIHEVVEKAGQAMQGDVSGFVEASGGKVIGSVRHPLNSPACHRWFGEAPGEYRARVVAPIGLITVWASSSILSMMCP